MLKIFGYGDNIREQALGNTHNDIELIGQQDYRTAWDINRPLENMYREVENLYDFLDAFGNYQLTDEGVFTGSLHHEFYISRSDTIRVTLSDKIQSVPTHEEKVYTKLAPGIAGIYHDQERQQSMIVLHRPNPRLLERQIAEILGIFYYNGEETVEVKYDTDSNLMKMRIKCKPHPEQPVLTYEFGGIFDDDGIQGEQSINVLADMYNEYDLNHRFVNNLGPNLEKLLFEPMYELTTTGTYFWEIVNGEVQLNTTGDQGFKLGQFDVNTLDPVGITNISNLHRKFGENVRTDIHGQADNSYELNSQGGVVWDIAKGFKVENSAGAKIEVSTIGDISINSAPGRNMEFGGVNLLGIQANEIVLTSIFTQDGTATIDASEAGEEFKTLAELHTENADTKNSTITDKNDTIETEVSNITSSHDIVVTKVNDITTETNNIGEQNNNITIKNDIIGTLNLQVTGDKNEQFDGNSVETVTGKKTLNANAELEINTPLLDKNITVEDETIGTQNSVITDLNETITNEISDVETKTETITTLTETIGTKSKTVTGNETEQVDGNSTETVVGDKSSIAQNQSINAVADIVISAPNITLDAGETGIVHIIGEQQTIEGTTVRLEDNIMELNKNQTGIPASGLFSGIEVNRGTQEKAQILYREEDDTWITGLATSLKAIARRENNNVIQANGIPVWDLIEKMFKTDSKYSHNRSTGSTTMNVDNSANTPPIITDSIKKVDNLNVDMVDNVHINNGGASTGEIVTWNGNNTLETSNKSFITEINGVSDVQVPTEGAVAKFAAMFDSFSIEKYSKGVRLTYTNGNGDIRQFSATALEVDTVDGAHVNRSGAAANELVMWGNTTTLQTSNKTVTTAFSLTPGDIKIPTEKAIKDWIDGLTRTLSLSGMATGTVQLVGSEAANMVITAIQNDSHTHDGRYYTESEANNKFLYRSWPSQQITGDFIITGSTDLRGDADVGGKLDVTGNATVGGTLGVTGIQTNSEDLLGSATKKIDGFGQVFNAIWNDIADFIEVEEGTKFEYGRVISLKDGSHGVANKKTKSNFIGIASDTFGFGVGQKPEGVPTIPIAIGGFVLSYTKIYPTGTSLETSNDGGLVKASFLTRLLHPERIIATFYKEETGRTWNDIIKVNGRHWVKIK